MKYNSPSRLFILIAVATLITACGPKPTEAPVEAPVEAPSSGGSSGEAWTAEEDITIPEGGGLPNLTIPAGTEVTPKSAKGNQEIEGISPSEIGNSLPALPEGKKIIAAVDITPDGQTFSPPVPVEIPLPSGHDYSAGDILEMMQLDKGSDKWLPAGEAEVDASEKLATGEIAHTSIFALVESGSGGVAAALDQLLTVEDLGSGYSLVSSESSEKEYTATFSGDLLVGFKVTEYESVEAAEQGLVSYHQWYADNGPGAEEVENLGDEAIWGWLESPYLALSVRKGQYIFHLYGAMDVTPYISYAEIVASRLP